MCMKIKIAPCITIHMGDSEISHGLNKLPQSWYKPKRPSKLKPCKQECVLQKSNDTHHKEPHVHVSESRIVVYTPCAQHALDDVEFYTSINELEKEFTQFRQCVSTLRQNLKRMHKELNRVSITNRRIHAYATLVLTRASTILSAVQKSQE